MAKKINITAQLNAATTDGILADAGQIFDAKKGKFQEQVNEEFENALEEAITSEDTDMVVESIEEGIVHNALRKTKQFLTEAEKGQARENIGAVSEQTFEDEAVRVKKQVFTSEQKYQARHNISAITAEEAEKIAEDKIYETSVSSPDKLQAVKELSSWLEENPDNAATMNEKISENYADIQRLYRGTGIDEYSQFSTGMDYAAGDVVLYDGVLFRFKVDRIAGAWDYNEVEEWSEKKEREEKLAELEEVVGVNQQHDVVLANIVRYYYLDGDKDDGSFRNYEGLSTAFYPIEKGKEYKVHIPHAANKAAWVLGESTANNISTKASIITEAGKGNSDVFDYEFVASLDGFVVVGIATDSENPTVTYKADEGGLKEEVKGIKEQCEENTTIVSKLESEVNGKIVGLEITPAETLADQYIVKETGKRSNYPNSNLAIVIFPLIQGGKYTISVAKTTNSAGYVLCYAETIGSTQTTPIIDKVGDRQAFEFSFVSDKDGFLFVGISADSEYTNLTKLSIGKGLTKKVEEVNVKVEEVTSNVNMLDKQINGEMVDIEVSAAETIANQYMVKDTGKISTYTDNNLAIVKFPISKDNSYRVLIAKTTNPAGYVLGYAETIGSTQTTPIIDKVGDRQAFEFSFVSDKDGFLFVGISADSEYTNLTTVGRSDGIVKDIEEIKKGAKVDWSSKKWVVIGDSLSTLNSTTSKRYIDYIAERTGIQVEVLAVGGSSWGQPQNDNNAFFQQATKVPADADIVTIFGSFNSWYKKDGNVITDGPISLGEIDSEDISTRYGCMNTAIKNIYANAPLARVGVIYPTPWKTANPYSPTETTNSLMEMLDSVTKRWGVPKLDLFHESGMRPWEEEYRMLVYSKDSGGIDGNPNGVHPNEVGHEVIATHVLEFMKRLIL